MNMVLEVGKNKGNDLARLNALYHLYKSIDKDGGKKVFGSPLGNKVIADNLFGYNDVVGFKMLVENGKNVGAEIYHLVTRVSGFIGKQRKPMFKTTARCSTVYFCKM